jgi:hypothetical protein
MGSKNKPAAVFFGWAKPDFSILKKEHKNYTSNYNAALMYAHYEMKSSELKKEVIKYLKTKNAKDPLLDRIKDLNENRFITIGKYFFILNHGGELPDNVNEKLIESLEKIIEEEEQRVVKNISLIEEKEEKEETFKITIQDRLREKAREVAGEIEGWVDDFFIIKEHPTKTIDDFVALFKTNDLKSVHMNFLRNALSKRIENFKFLSETKDKELLECYPRVGRSDFKKLNSMFDNFSSACDMLQEVAKANRTPRKKKPVSQEKLVSKLKYKKEDPTLGIVSQNPVQILGSKELWIYNTKTRKLAHYKAIDERGLAVKGTGLENYSQDSKEKTLRKPAETLAEFKKASKVKLRTFLKDLSTVDVSANGKLNEHCVILRIDK